MIIAALPLLMGVTGMRAGMGQSPPRGDFQGSVWQDAATTTGCTSAGCEAGVSGAEFLRWTRQAMAECEGCLIYVLGSETDRGLPMTHTAPAIPFLFSDAFDLHFSTGHPRAQRVVNWVELMADVRSKVRPDRRGPIFVADIRWDIVQRWTLDQAAPYGIDKAWMLRTDRPIQDFGAFLTSIGGAYSHCRSTNGNATEQYDDPAPGGDRCNRAFGTGNGEAPDPAHGIAGIRIYDQLEAKEAGLGDHMVAYTSLGSSPNFFPIATLLNLKHVDAQNWLVGMCAALIAQGFDACNFPHKIHHYCNVGTSAPCTAVQYWPVISGDGMGGADETMGLGLSSDLDELPELAGLSTGDIYSGRPEIANGVAGCATAGGCPWVWKEVAQGRVETQRKNTAAGNPTVVSVSPYLWRLCPMSPGDWDSAYDDASCANPYNDSDGAACESCTEREIAQRADIVLVNLGNKSLRHTSIGSGGGAGMSFDQLKALILNPPGGGPRPREVYPFNEYGTTNARGTPARIYGDPGQLVAANPEPGISGSPITVEIAAHCSMSGVITLAAPGRCTFEAIAHHNDPEIQPFHHLSYYWDFDDPEVTGQTWRNGRSRDHETYPIASHVFECPDGPCTRTISVTVADWENNVAQAEVTITVPDEDTAWGPSATDCVSTSGTFTDCPAGADHVTSSDFDATLQTATAKRTLYRCGESFAASAAPNVSQGTGYGSLMGGFGDCDPDDDGPAIVTWSSDTNLFDDGDLDKWVVLDMKFVASATPDGDRNPAALINEAGNYPQVSDALLLRVTVEGVSVCPGFATSFVNDAADGYNDRIIMQDVTCTAADTPSGGWPGALHSYRYGGLLNYRFTNASSAPAYPAGTRLMGMDRVIWAHGSHAIKTTGGGQAGEWSARSCGGLTTGDAPTDGGCDRADQFVVVANNDFFDDGTGQMRPVHLVNTHDLDDPATSGIEKRDWIFDANRIHFGTTVTRSTLRGIVIDGVQGLSITNNVFDFRRTAPSSGTDTAILQQSQCAGGAVDCGPDSDWWIAGNTVLDNSSGLHEVYLVNGAPEGAAYVSSNLVHQIGQADGTTLCGGKWDICPSSAPNAKNIATYQTAQCPFVGASSACNLSAASETVNPLELRIRSDSHFGRTVTATNGYSHPGGTASGWLHRDFRGWLRTVVNSVGGLEDDATGP